MPVAHDAARLGWEIAVASSAAFAWRGDLGSRPGLRRGRLFAGM